MDVGHLVKNAPPVFIETNSPTNGRLMGDTQFFLELGILKVLHPPKFISDIDRITLIRRPAMEALPVLPEHRFASIRADMRHLITSWVFGEILIRNRDVQTASKYAPAIRNTKQVANSENIKR